MAGTETQQQSSGPESPHADWGRCFWNTIHHVALAYPASDADDETKRWYANFYNTLWRGLPCAKCKDAYITTLSRISPVSSCLDSENASGSLFLWTVMLHNLVNVELGKSELPIDEAFALYQVQRLQGSAPCRACPPEDGPP